MKEFTIENKAQKYDKAFRIAQELYNDPYSSNVGKGYVCTVFPELKESEDEKVRKEIIAVFKGETSYTSEEDAKRYIAWLEKQGEQKPNPYTGTSFEYNGHNWGMCARDNGIEILFDGELKAFLSSEKSFIYPIHPQPYLAPKSASKAIKEKKVDNQNCIKSIDNVEPKFKVGDWIVFNGLILFIKEVVQGYYRTIYVNGIPNSYDWNIDNAARLWTIQDAKDGDVLHCWIDGDEFVLIYKGIKDGYITTYGHLYQKLKLFAEEPTTMFCKTTQGHFTPATKEQRDLLFQKMKEAGYEWDKEKKELKKIVDEEYNGKDYGIDSLWHAKNILEKTLGKVSGYQTDDGILEHKCAITAVNKLYKQKPDWSEEDERMRKDIIRVFKGEISFTSEKENEKYTAWLKSLKQRYTWKPSIAQLNALSIVSKGNAPDDIEAIVSLYNDLKKLKGE